MDAWFTEFALSFQGSPVIQAVVAAIGTFIMEDPVTVGCGLLVADKSMVFWAAFIGLACGICIGDFSLYLLGRYASQYVLKWGLVKQDKLEEAEAWFKRNMFQTVVGARFLPGLRIPAFVGAGVLRASPWKFLLVSACGCTVWTLFLLTLTVWLGELVKETLGALKWPLFAVVIGGIVVLHAYRKNRRRKCERSEAESMEIEEGMALPETEPVVNEE